MSSHVARAKELDEVAIHLCEKGCTAFKRIKKGDWVQHEADVCTSCNGRRFKEENGRLKPVKVGCFYILLVCAGLHDEAAILGS